MLLAWLLLLGATSGLARGEQARRPSGHFDHFSSADGLPGTRIYDLHQDRQGFLWLATQEGLVRFDGHRFVVFAHDPADPRSLPESFVTSIAEDSRGDLWLTTFTRGLTRFDIDTQSSELFQLEGESPGLRLLGQGRSGDVLWLASSLGPLCFDLAERQPCAELPVGEAFHDWGSLGVLEDRGGDYWLLAYDGLRRVDRVSGAVRHYAVGAFGQGTADPTRPQELFEDRSGRLWVAVHRGLSVFDPESDTFHYHPLETARRWSGGRSDLSFTFYGLSEDRSGALWVATLQGAYRLDPKTGAVDTHHHRPGDAASLSADFVLDILEDRTGVVWLATNNGLDRYDPRRQVFELFRYDPAQSESLGEGTVLSVDPGGDGVWVSTAGSGFSRLRVKDGRAERFPPAEDGVGLSNGQIWNVLEDREGTVWLGTEVGLDRFEPSTGRFRHYDAVAGEENGLSRVTALHEDFEGRLWIGDSQGLLRMDRQREVLERLKVRTAEGTGPPEVLALLGDPRRRLLWVGTNGFGLYRVDPESGVIEHFAGEPLDTVSSSRNIVVTLRLDGEGALWVATLGGGLLRVDPEARTLRAYGREEGLPSPAIRGFEIVEDGHLWLSTAGALARFDPRTERGEIFSHEQGLFIAKAHGLDADGRLYFGTSEGLVTFHPDDVERDPQPPPAVVLTELRILNQPMAPGLPGSPLEHALHRTRELTLDHRAYAFSLEFAAMHLADPSRHRFAYRLEGLDREWIETDATRRVASYSNLEPGRYVFRVKAASHGGVWNEQGATLRIHILPPPWRTGWAYGLYALVLVLGLGVVGRGQARKLALERAVAARERAANERLREADRAKDDFLANTSHELRTPLYGIVGLAESLLAAESDEMPLQARQKLTTIIASGRRLQGLVGDVLDFSRLEGGHIELRRRPVDVRDTVDMAFSLAAPLAETKDLVLCNDVPTDLPAADADVDRLQQVLLNLVGNAIKFTHQGEVAVLARRRGEKWLEVTVRDTGIGIAPEQHDRIFEVFEQADGSIERRHGGTGLGLAVSRRLVELHGGGIRVESAVGEGASFVFTLPVSTASGPSALVRPEALPPPTVSAPGPAAVEPAEDSPAKRGSILVVDDEPVNRQILSEQLGAAGFAVTEAADGAQALELASRESFDLVVLDVMMPGMSGYEVCRRLREDFPLLELPILFLSAKDGSEDLQAGLAAGGNDYLGKPLARAELLARVELHMEMVRLQRRLDDLLAERTERVKMLSGMLPICADCKKIRDDEGYWNDVEVFVSEHSDAMFSHGLCPQCAAAALEEVEGFEVAEIENADSA